MARGPSALAAWRDAPSGALRLTTFGTAARVVLAPRLPQFLIDHPAVAVDE